MQKQKVMKQKKTRKQNPWLAHVAKFRKSHKNMPYSQVLKAAKATYKK